jgi:hypothetical protein
MIYPVPFVENPDGRCLPATISMVLAYFMSNQTFTAADVETLCGYEKGRGTWPAPHMLGLARLGFKVRWIEDFDHTQFIRDPEAYLRSILDKDAVEWQLAHGDLSQEAARMQDYITKGLPLERRRGTNEDIRQFLDDGWLVRLEVNARTLSGKPGYDGHSVLVVGYTDDEVIIHNPDGDSGNKPNQHVTWQLLGKAWKEFGGSYSLYAFKKG